MADNQFQKQSRAKTLLNDYLQPHPETEQPFQGSKYNGQMRWEQKNNGDVVLRMYDGVYNPNQKNIVREVTMNYNERGVLFDTIRQAADIVQPFSTAQLPINQKVWTRENGQNKISDEPVNVCNFIITRDDKGRVTMTYQKGDYTFKTIFRLHNVAALRFKNAAGEVTEDYGFPSRASARTWCNFHESILNEMEMNAWKPRGGNNNQNNNNGGNNFNRNNNGGNNGGSMNQTTTEYDEDIDW